MNRLGETMQRAKRSLRTFLQRPTYDGKVFCIGFNKTGTTSCGKALEMLGYRHSSFNRTVWRRYYQRGRLDRVLRYTARYDSFDDLPWLKEDMVPLLDRTFPGSKFIYLTRDEESWKRSIDAWTLAQTGRHPDIEEKLAEFRKHREFVLSYFADWPADRFLVLDVREENAFQKLAEFLGKAPPQESFPHANRTGPSG